jgi:hypothetical protein
MTKNSFIGLLAVAAIAILVGIWIGIERNYTIDTIDTPMNTSSVNASNTMLSDEMLENMDVVEEDIDVMIQNPDVVVEGNSSVTTEEMALIAQ